MTSHVAEITQGYGDQPLYREIIDGLTATRKTLSPKLFYDKIGSRYFDEICTLDEYYLYQSEMVLLPKVAEELDIALTEDVSVVEFGAGSLHKIQPLLERVGKIKEFIPIDISEHHLMEASSKLRLNFKNLDINPFTADFCQPIELPQSRYRRMGFFPGSTIGNFTPDEAQLFLRNALGTLGEGALLLIGVDTKKSAEILHAAYNDSQGVTAKFNLNALHRINREFDGDINVDNFEHYAFYQATLGRIEMHLISLLEQDMFVGGHCIRLHQGESIHTENSYKYSLHDFGSLARLSGWEVARHWIADQGMFSMYLLSASSEIVSISGYT